ncbi:hypothetical protein BS78_05G208100 [Paspalum vaginatum]|nr:hypothetical protein BS78_05G208100 [Paspalum vaginatum]
MDGRTGFIRTGYRSARPKPINQPGDRLYSLDLPKRKKKKKTSGGAADQSIRYSDPQPPPMDGGSKRKAEEGGASPREAEEKCPATDAAAAAAGDTPIDASMPVAGAPTMRLPAEYLEWIFSQKRTPVDEDPDECYNRMINDPEMVAVFTREYIEDETQIMRDIAAANQLMADTIERFQLLEKGYVEVDAAHMAGRVRNWEIHFRGKKQDE